MSQTYADYEQRAAALIAQMTLEEKISQITAMPPAIPRLGIPACTTREAVHGIVGVQATSFPHSVAAGATWDPELIRREATAIADELCAYTNAASHKTNRPICWSPVVEPMRDPRWGRNQESYSEDPYLTGEISGAFVSGLLGDDEYLKVVGTAKHFAANNSEYNRHGGDSVMSETDFREYYLYPYRHLVKKYGLAGIMSSYNRINGIPASANVKMLDDILRKTWGYQGYVTGDCDAISDMYLGHHYARSFEEAAALGLKGCVSNDCGDIYVRFTAAALEQGLLTEDDLDRALLYFFTMRMRMGEFDGDKLSMKPYTKITKDILECPNHLALAEEVAEKSLVLLENNGVLPLNAASIKKIAVVGPQSNYVELGGYSGSPKEENRVSPLQGITAYLKAVNPNAEIVTATGSSALGDTSLAIVRDFTLSYGDGHKETLPAIHYTDQKGPMERCVFSMDKSMRVTNINAGNWLCYEDIEIGNLSEVSMVSAVPGGGGVCELHLDTPDGLLLGTIPFDPITMAPPPSFEDVPEPESSDIPDFMAQLADSSGSPPLGAIAGMTHEGQINRLGLSGRHKVYVVFRGPAVSDIDPEAIQMSADSDAVVVCVGTDNMTAGEESDRGNLKLPGNQEAFILQVAKQNPNTIVVIQSCGAVEVEAFRHKVAAILYCGFNGQRQGEALAKTIFGDNNPGGKLNFTWYASTDDLADMNEYHIQEAKRTYWYYEGPISYPFGYGLSYTSFSYENASLSKDSLSPYDTVLISVDVKNTGNRIGDEVVQVYVSPEETPSNLRLKGFRRVRLAPGETIHVEIPVDCADLWRWDEVAKRCSWEQGNILFQLGSSSRDIFAQMPALLHDAAPIASHLTVRIPGCAWDVGRTEKVSAWLSLSDDTLHEVDPCALDLTTSNAAVATVHGGNVTAKAPGHVTITATFHYNGQTITGTLPLAVKQ